MVSWFQPHLAFNATSATFLKAEFLATKLVQLRGTKILPFYLYKNLRFLGALIFLILF